MPTNDDTTGGEGTPNPPQDNLSAEIQDFETWYKYGEEVGQVRLYNFLMGSSILFLACAALIAAHDFLSYIHAIIVASFGYFLSGMFKLYGKRQNKFILMFEVYLGRALDKLGAKHKAEREKLAAYYLLEMKKENSLVIPLDAEYRLDKEERTVSTRTTLIDVPRYFQHAFLATGGVHPV